MATKKQKIADLEDKLRRLRAEAKKMDRRDDTRRKIIYGAALLAFADSADQKKRKFIMARVEPFITRQTDREFLGLPSRQRAADEKPDRPETADLPLWNDENA